MKLGKRKRFGYDQIINHTKHGLNQIATDVNDFIAGLPLMIDLNKNISSQRQSVEGTRYATDDIAFGCKDGSAMAMASVSTKNASTDHGVNF